jgi:HEAT repeat protein
LRKGTEDREVRVSVAARLALWRTAGEENQVQLALDEAVQAKSFVALTDALLWLGDLGPAGAPMLVNCLKHSDAQVRWLAAYALWEMAYELGDIGPATDKAVSALIEALNDPDPEVRKHAASALRAIDPEAANLAGVE